MATDYARNEWSGGYTSVDFFTDHKHGWPLTGEIRGLSTRAEGFWVAKTSSVEMLLVPPLSLPMNEWMATTTRLGGHAINMSRGPGRQIVEVLDTKVVFSNDPSGEALWTTAETSEKLGHPFAERWLSEPLRIMLGAPVYPRMTARNFGDGTASVTFLPAPRQKRLSPFGLQRPWGMCAGDDTAFWQLYADILTMIANTREDGHPIMDGHAVTRYYEELSRAQRGSRWVMLLTLASTTEALAKSLMSEADRQSEFSDKALESMDEYLRAWKEDPALRGRMLGNLGMVRERSVLAFMRSLGKSDLVNPAHVDTWHRMRNSAMHGHLVEPWSTEEGDDHLREMIALVHALTRLRIAKG